MEEDLFGCCSSLLPSLLDVLPDPCVSAVLKELRDLRRMLRSLRNDGIAGGERGKGVVRLPPFVGAVLQLRGRSYQARECGVELAALRMFNKQAQAQAQRRLPCTRCMCLASVTSPRLHPRQYGK